MDLIETINEIGILETNKNIENYLSNKFLVEEISYGIPLPEFGSTNIILDNAIKNIIDKGKENIFMLSNEIAFIEQLALHKEHIKSIIVGLSSSLLIESVNNIKKNTPIDINVKYINELEFPKIIRPKNSVLIAFGYKSFNNCFVTRETFRMIELYRGFLGQKVFISCNLGNVVKPKGLVSINSQVYFDEVI